MGNVFQFHDHLLELDFNGLIFKLDMTDHTRFEKLGKLSEQFAKKMDGDKADIGKAVDFVVSAIDDLLGESATADIFGERQVNLPDLADVMKYISEEITAYYQKYHGQPSPDVQNRAQRRQADTGVVRYRK